MLQHRKVLADLARQLGDILWHLVRRGGDNLSEGHYLGHLVLRDGVCLYFFANLSNF